MSTNLAGRESKKHKQINEMIGYLLNNLKHPKENDETEDLLKMISIAKQELLDAQCYFDSVDVPELVDHAIYKIEAANSQYVYLLKLAKNKGLRVNI